ncbi:MAG: aldo/keto reductase [Sediminicola sp.]|tara:strand:+ start:120252 stop:121127 length:876 start_codon:yes stop_codon:yes gene_type:complete
MKNSICYSKIIAGTMGWGSWGKGLSTSQMAGLLEHCLHNGITTFDHADIYGDYTNEGEFGKALLDSGLKREGIQLISKCGIQLLGGARRNPLKYYEYSREYIIRSAERSLECLGTDYLDLFLLHRPSPLMDPHEIAEAILELQKQGKIREFGVSNFTPSQMALLESVIPISANQLEFSLTENAAMYNGSLDAVLVSGAAAMAWSPLGSYFRTEDTRRERIRKVLLKLTSKYGATEDQLLLSWILRHPAKVYPVVGTASKERLTDAGNALKIKMETTDWFALLAAEQGHEVP